MIESLILVVPSYCTAFYYENAEEFLELLEFDFFQNVAKSRPE